VLVLVALTALVLAAATAATARWFPEEGRGAAIVDAGVLATGLVAGPLLGLGYAGALGRGTVASAVGGLAAGVLLLALRSPGSVARWVALLRRIVALPGATLAEAWRARHVAVVGVAVVVGCAVWTAVLAYLAPSSSWDGMWYHDAIVGFAIQERGFAWVDVPKDLAFVNGYPKTSEMLSLWLVLFWDDRLLELPASVYGPFAVVAFAVLCRRVIGDHLNAVAWGCALFLVPGVVLQLRSSYVDVPFLAMSVAAAEVVTRPRLRAVDVVLGGVALGLLGGMKGTGLVLVPALGLVLGVRWARRVGRRAGGAGTAIRWLGAGVAAAALLVALMAPPYVRNLGRTGNPAWPVRVTLPLGLGTLPGTWVVDMPKPFPAAVEDVYGAFVPDQQFHDVKVGSYGRLPPWVVPPLAMVGLVVAATGFGMRRRRSPLPRRRLGRDGTVWALALGVLPTVAFSPAWYLARFNLHALAVLYLCAARGLASSRARPAAHLVVAALVGSGVVDLARARPGWEVPVGTARRLAAEPPVARAAVSITPVMGAPGTLRAIEDELGPGDVVAFTTEFGFPAVLWNRHFSNRLVWVHGRGEGYLGDLDQAGAVWAVAKEGTPEDRALRRAGDRWAPVGKTSDVNVAYRRRRPAEGSPGPDASAD